MTKSNQNLRKKLNAVDSGIGFLGAILVMYAASIVAYYLLVIILIQDFLTDPSFTQNVYQEKPWAVAIVNTLPQICFFIFVIIFCRLRKVDFGSALQVNKKPNYFVIAVIPFLAAFLIISNLPLLTAVDNIFERIGYKATDINIKDMLTSPWGFAGAILLFCIIPALFEELIFRGIVLQGLASRFKPFSAILLSALAFSLTHMSPAQTVHQFLLGVALGYAVLATKSIWSGVLIHFFNNLYALILTILPSGVFNFPFLDNTIFIYAGGIIFSILGLIAFFLAIDFANSDAAEGILAKSIKSLIKKEKYDGFLMNYDIILPPDYPITEEDYKKYAIEKEKRNRKKFIIMYIAAFGICGVSWLFSLIIGIIGEMV
ncbi:MAG TPA: CPBP family intramembrane glutamic endopeptidase [Clostridia bacterium]